MNKEINARILAIIFLGAGLISYFYIGIDIDTGVIIGLFFFGLGLGILLGQDMEKKSAWLWSRRK